MRLALFGATGRMGLAITRLASQSDDIQVVGAICAASDRNLARDIGELAGVGTLGVETAADIGAGLLGADVVIDFSTASAVAPLLDAATKRGIAVVSGTTNLDDAGRAALLAAAEKVPVLWAPNMSRGVQVLAELVTHAVRRLGVEFDVEIVETHHRRKVDAPSGTAKRLARAVHEARSGLSEVYGREGDVGARPDAEIAILALRGGDIVGDHTVHLFGPNERLELTHRATNRDVFASGALAAARFVVGRAPRLYELSDMLGST
jgi:4-hydroxy-tetrahydrodipicolinate reductase